VFRLVDLVCSCDFVGIATTINSTPQEQTTRNQQQAATIYNKRNKNNNTHNNQTVGAFLLLVQVRPCFFLYTWFVFLFLLLVSQA
jgi:hypothetical protein